MPRLLLVLALGWLAADVRAQSPRGTTTASDHTFERAGFPNVIAPWARPSQSPKYMPGYVGGSIPFGGGGPVAPVDGVFGYDYVGSGPPGRVFLGWAHHPTYPRMGPYRTDGPRVFDIFSVRPVRRALSPGEKGD
jgi:hypothetical protein